MYSSGFGMSEQRKSFKAPTRYCLRSKPGVAVKPITVRLTLIFSSWSSVIVSCSSSLLTLSSVLGKPDGVLYRSSASSRISVMERTPVDAMNFLSIMSCGLFGSSLIVNSMCIIVRVMEMVAYLLAFNSATKSSVFSFTWNGVSSRRAPMSAA